MPKKRTPSTAGNSRLQRTIGRQVNPTGESRKAANLSSIAYNRAGRASFNPTLGRVSNLESRAIKAATKSHRITEGASAARTLKKTLRKKARRS